MKVKSFFGGLFLLLFLNALVKPVWIFFIDRQVQIQVGLEAYGLYFSLFNLSYILLFAADAGLTNLLTQRIASGSATGSGQLFQTKAALLLFYVVLCLTVGWLTGIAAWQIFLPLVLLQALSSLFLFLRGLLTASQAFKTDAVFSVTDKLLVVLLCLGPVYGFFGKIHVLLFVYLQLLATAVATVLLTAVCYRRRLFPLWQNNDLSFRWLRQLLPFAAIILLMATHYRLDGFLLERLHADGARQAGIYAAAYRLLDAANIPGYLCASFLVPFVARHKNDLKVVANVVVSLRHVLLFAGILMCTAVWVFASSLQQLLYHSSDVYVDDVLRFCFAVLPAYYLAHVYGSLLTAKNDLRPFIAVITVCMIVNLSANVLLIPRYGALGACYSALASQYGCGLWLWYRATYAKENKNNLFSGWIYLLWAAGCFGLLLCCRQTGNAVWIILALTGLLLLLAASQKQRIKQFVAFLNS